jgi:hypothetical protein
MTDDKTDAVPCLQATQQPLGKHSSQPRRGAALTALGAATARRNAVTRCVVSPATARGTAPASAASRLAFRHAAAFLRRLRPLRRPLRQHRRPRRP